VGVKENFAPPCILYMESTSNEYTENGLNVHGYLGLSRTIAVHSAHPLHTRITNMTERPNPTAT
jgi:hypothetical protein